jgi:hypothetical protein
VLWVLLDVVIGVLAVLLVALVAFLVYKRIRVLMSAIGAASRDVGQMTPGLSVQPPRSEVR